MKVLEGRIWNKGLEDRKEGMNRKRKKNGRRIKEGGKVWRREGS